MGPPSVISLGKYTAIFNKDGTWSYSAKMAGKLEGMEMKGTGTWKVDGSILVYTIGDNQGKSNIQIRNTVLTLSPDPVLLYNGTEPIETLYNNVP
ncbi:hypothetical protein [Rubritalea sp.]|uniref:hypothetical protein n=1 Tax=Rubritalea sp. TaxID=2109375 RepID=UPI003EFAD019